MANLTDEVATVLAGLNLLEADVPRIDDVGAQGDVLVSKASSRRARTPLLAPVAVVDGEYGGHAHTLHPAGECFWEQHDLGETGLKLGVLTVSRGARAFLFHEEHGGLEILPGTYRIGRQREYERGGWRQVAD